MSRRRACGLRRRSRCGAAGSQPAPSPAWRGSGGATASRTRPTPAAALRFRTVRRPPGRTRRCPQRSGTPPPRPQERELASPRPPPVYQRGRPFAALPVICLPPRLLVERRLDLGDLLGLEVRARLGVAAVARLGPAAEVQSEPGEGVGAVAADLLECREELLLGLRARERARRHLVRGPDLDRPVALQAGRRRDQLPDDDVLLQSEQPVDLALDRGVGEHLRRLLEGRGREEGLRRERRLRDPEDQRLRGCLLLLLLLHARVLALEHDLVHELARQELGVAVVLDPDLLQHLPDDQLDVLVVDLDALRLVDLLHLADEVQLGLRIALQAQEVGGVERSLVQRIARLDVLALRDAEPRPAGDEDREVVLLVTGVSDDCDPQLALGLLEGDGARDLGERRGALRVARLEDLDDARQAVRDVGAGDAARVERPHRELRARLADRLRGDDPDRVPDLRQLARREERAVALAAYAGLGLALQHRPDRDREVLGHLAELLDDVPQPGLRDLLALRGDDRLARLARSQRLMDVLSDDP